MNKDDMIEVLKDVKFKDWTFHVESRPVYDPTITAVTYAHYLQVRFMEKDTYGDGESMQSGRKWILSEHMKRSEVVTTAFKAIMTAIEHETRETFRYKGRTIFGPHIDVESLWGACRKIEIRDDPSTVAVD